MSLNEILASGGALLLFLTLVQITPIKVNPWSAVGKIIGNGMRAIGKSMNKDVMDKLKEGKTPEQLVADGMEKESVDSAITLRKLL